MRFDKKKSGLNIKICFVGHRGSIRHSLYKKEPPRINFWHDLRDLGVARIYRILFILGGSGYFLILNIDISCI